MRFKIDWASLMAGSKFIVFALFYFVFEGNFPSSSHRGAFIWRGDLTEGFCVTGLGGLYLEELIHGGAYFPNFTVSGSRIEDIEGIKNRKENILKNFFCSILVH